MNPTQANIFDSDLFAVFLTLITIVIALPALYFAMPKIKYRNPIIIAIAIIIWGLSQWGIYAANSDKEFALNRIILSQVILLVCAAIGVITYIVVSSINKKKMLRYISTCQNLYLNNSILG